MSTTEAGAALAALTARAPALLTELDSVLRASKAAGSHAARVLRVGFVASAANEHTQQIIATFARHRPGWRVEMCQSDWSDPTAGLADGHVDAALLRLPFPGQETLRIETLLTEPRWVALPADHPLAAKDEIDFKELWNEPFIATPPESGWWREYWPATDEHDGDPVRIGVIAHNPDEWP
jgi:DNA-binding transcriptional LysR family regulator